jgi:hypothetical protein
MGICSIVGVTQGFLPVFLFMIIILCPQHHTRLSQCVADFTLCIASNYGGFQANLPRSNNKIPMVDQAEPSRFGSIKKIPNAALGVRRQLTSLPVDACWNRSAPLSESDAHPHQRANG